MSRKLAVIRIRGPVKLGKDVESTLKMLNLWKKNACILITETDSLKGMVNRVKDFVTYGDISEETEKALAEKRPAKNKIHNLHPPLKGYGRKGIKVSFNVGGALGDRKEKINDLIMRML